MAANDDPRRDGASPADEDRGAGPQDSAALEPSVPSFEDVLASLPPEQRELAILASNGC